MKNVVSIVLIALHLFFVTGVKVDMHFCKDTLRAVSISKVSPEKISCCNHDLTKSEDTSQCKKASCCEDTSATLLSLSSFSKEQVKQTLPILAAVFLPSLLDNTSTEDKFSSVDFSSPPKLQNRAIYLTTSSFCFYG
ncbi:MAG: HYC_CC_PP family protein [Bacteroidia bacterium]